MLHPSVLFLQDDVLHSNQICHLIDGSDDILGLLCAGYDTVEDQRQKVRRPRDAPLDLDLAQHALGLNPQGKCLGDRHHDTEYQPDERAENDRRDLTTKASRTEVAIETADERPDQPVPESDETRVLIELGSQRLENLAIILDWHDIHPVDTESQLHQHSPSDASSTKI